MNRVFVNCWVNKINVYDIPTAVIRALVCNILYSCILTVDCWDEIHLSHACQQTRISVMTAHLVSVRLWPLWKPRSWHRQNVWQPVKCINNGIWIRSQYGCGVCLSYVRAGDVKKQVLSQFRCVFIGLFSLPYFYHNQSGRSPKVVALFPATNFSSYIIELL